MMELAAWRPAAINPVFEEKASMLSFIDKLELFLADAQESVNGYQDALRWLRDTVNHQTVEYKGPQLDELISDILGAAGKQSIS